MIKRTLYFGSQAYLHTLNEQLVIEKKSPDEQMSIPIEDVGIIILDHPQLTVTSSVLSKLLANNVGVITCDKSHHPTGMLLNLDGHTLQQKIFAAQVEASLPLKKQLWQQTVVAKIRNQAKALKKCEKGGAVSLTNLAREVKSGDAENHEAQAAALYWKQLFAPEIRFQRDRFGFPPNNLLNYGYAILRGLVARSIAGSGLLPTLGIFHRNQYNAYCLADDIMEPYRPFVDILVVSLFDPERASFEISKDQKKVLLSLPVIDVLVNGQRSPLMTAVQRTTASLARCFQEKSKEIIYATFCD